MSTIINLAILQPSQGLIVIGDAAGDQTGWSVASAGDVNGDGIDDFIVGAPLGGSGGSPTGRAYVIFGTAGAVRANIDLTTLAASDGFIIEGDAINDQAGEVVARAGDINGDGIDDVIVGASTGDDGGTSAGEAYVIFGRAGATRANIDLSTLSPGDGFIIQGDAAYDFAGRSVSSAGDINGDGIDDVIVGAPGVDNGGINAGRAYVIFGRAGATRANIDLATFAASDGFFVQGDAGSDSLGVSVSSAGDVNGDGIDDLIVSAPAGDNGGTGAGEAYVIFGRAGATRANIDLSTFAASDGFIIQGDAPYDAAGRSAAAAGDINGDGFADLIVGASSGDNGGVNAGEAYVIFGRAGATRADIDLAILSPADGFIIQGDAVDDAAGGSVAAAGDINGDGFDDLLVGALNNDLGGIDAGAAYIIFGKVGATRGNIDLTALPPHQGIIVQGAAPGDRLARSVASAGDVNGDGFADVLVGAHFGDLGGLNAGQAYVLFGAATLNDTGGLQFGTNGNDILNGASRSDSLYGREGNDVIYAGADDDLLDGGSGADTMDGGLGNDTYIIDDAGDAVIDAGGVDTINASISYVLGTGLENLTLTGSGNLQGVGNGLGNVLTANSGINQLSGLGGDDVFLFRAHLTAADTVDGGSGNDQLGISGNYTAGAALVLGATTITNVEVLALLPGAGNSYAVTMNNGNVAAGVEMTIFAGNLGAGQNFTFNGAAETDGFFRTFGGLGTDTITGGGLNDGFYFGPGKWQAGDSVVGGGGPNDQLALDGDYTITLGTNADVETLALLASPDAGNPNDFNITLSDSWNGGGGRRTVWGRNNTTAMTINGAAETIGSFTFFGGRAGDSLTTGAGNDLIFGMEGNDAITGGQGIDTAAFQGLRASYSINTSGGFVLITDDDAVADGNDGNDILIGVEIAQFSDQQVLISAPIILDLDGGGVETLSASQSNARFDLDGDGVGDDTSWFGRGEGLLFLDRDGNGTVSNAGEFSFVDDVPGARSDLEGLRAFDSNGDGQLSSADARFRDFKIWRDRDGDGVVDRREVMTLRQAGVRSLSLTGTANSGTYALGDTAVVNTGSFTRTNGRQGGLIDAVLTAVSSKAETDALAAMRSAVASDTGGTDTGIDARIALMTQDMASFGATRVATETDRWRREGVPQLEMFAA